MYDQQLYQSSTNNMPLTITITLTEGALLIFLQSGVDKLLALHGI